MKKPKSFAGSTGVLNKGKHCFCFCQCHTSELSLFSSDVNHHRSLCWHGLVWVSQIWFRDFRVNYSESTKTRHVRTTFLTFILGFTKIYISTAWRKLYKECLHSRSLLHMLWHVTLLSTSPGTNIQPSGSKTTPRSLSTQREHYSSLSHVSCGLHSTVNLLNCSFNSLTCCCHSKFGAFHLSVRSSVSLSTRPGIPSSHPDLHLLEHLKWNGESYHGC